MSSYLISAIFQSVSLSISWASSSVIIILPVLLEKIVLFYKNLSFLENRIDLHRDKPLQDPENVNFQIQDKKINFIIFNFKRIAV